MTAGTPAFEHDYQQKLMVQRFAPDSVLASRHDVQAWRQAWFKELSGWHSPYKVLVDVTGLKVTDSPEIREALSLMVRFFQGFHLRKVSAYGLTAGAGHEALPFTVSATPEEAAVDLGIRTPQKREPTDFRSTIQIQNHFQTHVVEVTFAEPVVISTREQVTTLKSKLQNNLMQWHSKWSLLIDCTNLEIDAGMRAEFEPVFRLLRGFFMKAVVGYSPRGAKESYPFDVYRARHRAVTFLEGEGNFSGDKADCNSRKGQVSK